MISSAASRAIVLTTARLQLRLSVLRLSARCYAKESYEPPRRQTGGSIPREAHVSGYNGPDYSQPRPNRENKGEKRGSYSGRNSPRVGRNMGYDGHNYERRDTRERQPANSKGGGTDWLGPRKKKSSTAEDTIVPQLTQPELRSVFSQELFVFRCDLNATQIRSAMSSYPQLRDVGILNSLDTSNLARQIHTRFRLDRTKDEALPYIKTLISDIKSGKIPGHPLASVHTISCLKEMEEFTIANEFWKWLEPQNEEHTDARVYGAAIECFAYQGEPLSVMEEMYTEALKRYSNSATPTIARDTGKGTRLMLFQGIITARLLHGDWAAAYEGFDICTRLYPTLTPSRLYELIIYERPVREAYIVFLMACRAGTPPKPAVLTPLLKQLWSETGDTKAMIRALYAFVGAGGKASFEHLNSLIGAVFGVVGRVPKNVRKGPEWDKVYENATKFTRDLIGAFAKAGVQPSLSTFNTIITLGGKLERLDLVYSGLKELAASRLEPNLVTYRVILNAFGEIGDPEAVRTSWRDLCNAKEESKEAWDFKDLRALVRACVRTSQTKFCRSEVEKLQLTIGYSLYSSTINSIFREKQKIFTEVISKEIPPEQTPFPISQSSQHEVQEEIQCLNEIFSSSQIHDFASSTKLSTLPANIGPKQKETVVDIDSTSPSFSEIPQTELQKFYDTLTATASKVDIGEDPLQRTATGYSVKDLRFENWRSVNRLLYEAEIHEQEQKEKIIKAAKKRAVEEGVLGAEVEESQDKQDVRKLFRNEERAKKRIEEIRRGVKAVEGVREAGEGWKKEELRIRGRMGGEMKEPLRVSDVVVP